MSGGSFNYLYYKCLAEAMWGKDFEMAMSDLRERPYSTEAGQEMSAILEDFRDLDERFRQLEGVLKALEWWRSGDASEEDLKEACAKWKKG